jgi:DNase/tRNase domain of colicin-like bacteriocin
LVWVWEEGWQAGFTARTTHPNSNSVVEVDYDKNGFPDFSSHSAGREYHIQRRSSDTYAQDFSNATYELKRLFPNNVEEIAGSTAFLIKEGDTWKKYTWHHHQDGKTLIPVLSDVHGYTQHTGGNAIITRDLVGLFESP